MNGGERELIAALEMHDVQYQRAERAEADLFAAEAERDRLADENRALREAARAVAFCDSCGEPTHEPNEDCWFMDRSSCAYALNPNGGGTCSFDCRDEPSCMTDGPYPMERLRLVLAAADRGVTDGEATTSRRPVQFDAYASNPWPDGEATDG